MTLQPPPALRYRSGRLKDLSPLPPPKSDGARKFKRPGRLRSDIDFKRTKPFRGSLSKWIREAEAKRGAKIS